MTINKLIPPSSEDDIISHWKHKDCIYVSLICPTYNQEKFIAQTIESFLSQKTDYKFEIVIHDDCSSDNTRDIISQYYKKYPNIIKVIFQDENQFSKGKQIISLVTPFAKGKYIALCEGDDYWTDDTKIQKQVSFLETNPDYVMSYHNASVVDSSGNIIKPYKIPEEKRRDITQQELAKGKLLPLTLSWMYRNNNYGDLPELDKVLNGDVFFCSMLGLHGKAKYHNDISPAIYRVHNGGIWSKKDDRYRKRNTVNTFYWLYRYHSRVKSEYRFFFLKRFIIKSIQYYFKYKSSWRNK